jgi:hypothetical protein
MIIKSECGMWWGWQDIRFPVLLESKSRKGYIILFVDNNSGMCVASPDAGDIGLRSNTFYDANEGSWEVYQGTVELINKGQGND